MYPNRTESFVKGLIFGAAAGAVAALLLAPQSGEKTREDLKKLAKDFGEKATDYYNKARKEIEKKIEQLKAVGEKIDEGKYKKLVEEVMAEIRQDSEVTSDVAKRMGEQLRNDWSMVKESLSE